MADQDFNIKVVTTADTSGLKQTSDAMTDVQNKAGRLSIDEANRLGRIASERRRSLRAALPPVPEELGGTAKVAEEIEKVGPSALFAGINLAKARQEATFLARELATGVPSTRTLSSLLGSLGPYLAGAVGAGFALNRAITANAERQLQLNQELDAQLVKLTELDKKWSGIAKSVTGPQDTLNLINQIVPSLDAASAKFTEFQNKGISGWKELSDTLTAGIPGAGKIFENLFQAESGRLAEERERLREAGAGAAKLGLEYKAAFDKAKISDFQTEVSKLQKSLGEKRPLFENLIKSGDIESAKAVGDTIKRDEEILSAVIELEKERAQIHKTSSADFSSDTEKINDELRETQKILQAIGISARTPAQALEQGIAVGGRVGAQIAALANQWVNLQNKQREALSGDLFKGPVTAIDEARKRQLEFNANAAAQRELAAEGIGKEVAPAEKRKFEQEEELRLLQRKQALQRSLIPEGGDVYGSEGIKELGKQGMADFLERERRIKELQQQLNSPQPQAQSQPIPQAQGADGEKLTPLSIEIPRGLIEVKMAVEKLAAKFDRYWG